MLDFTILRELRFKLFDLTTADECSAVQQCMPSFCKIVAKPLMLCFQIHERDYLSCLIIALFRDLSGHYLLLPSLFLSYSFQYSFSGIGKVLLLSTAPSNRTPAASNVSRALNA